MIDGRVDSRGSSEPLELTITVLVKPYRVLLHNVWLFVSCLMSANNSWQLEQLSRHQMLHCSPHHFGLDCWVNSG